MSDEEQLGQRIDQWLWVARFFKTRSMAAAAVRGGRISLNGHSTKPAKTVKRCDCVSIKRESFDIDVVVQNTAPRRGPASVAQTLYEETPQSLARREKQRAESAPSGIVEDRKWGKLDKKSRRERERMKRALRQG
ncbi:MAG: RNA-binding S4 domain-containing protein [Pseudomonadota bacterium]